MKNLRPLSLSIIPLLLLSFVPTAATAQVTNSHEVVESPNGIEVSNSNPIPYYPGVLIGISSSYRVVDAHIVANSSAGRSNVEIGNGAIADSSGTRQRVIVITDTTGESRFIIGIGTIILLASDGTYQSAETDVYVQNETSAWGLVSTQEIIYQTTPEMLTQHYNLLADALVTLTRLYASAGAPQVSAVYSRLVGQLHELSSIISSNFSMYDKTISTPAGLITLQVVLDSIYQCSSVYLAQNGGPNNPYIIDGTFISYVNKGYNDYNFIQFSGEIGFGGVSEGYQVLIYASPIAITSASITPAWGAASIDYVTQQISSTDVLWTTTGLPGGWSITVGTNSASAPSPANVGVEDNSIGWPQWGQLALC